MNLRRRTTCRVCGSSALREVINLGDQYLQGSFVKEGVPNPPMRKIPCSLVRCCPEDDENACGLLQMRHSVPPEILYSTYWYASGVNQTMRDHLAGIVREALLMRGGEPGKALDIGCNDCTLLSNYPPEWNRLGVDPSDVSNAHPEIQVIKDVFPLTSGGIWEVDIITSIAMFYDLEEPVKFAQSIKQSLLSDGLWIMECSYMALMLKNNSYDTICHEHTLYLSFSVIERICREAGLKVVRAELNASNGGSIRCYITHTGSKAYDRPEWSESLHKLRMKEFDLALDTDAPYEAFQKRIDQEGDKLRGLLRDLKREGKLVHIYGASTKGNTILQWCEINSWLVAVAADRNPEKWGGKTLGTNIPIVSEEESRAMNPDVYLVLPWHFREEFIRREFDFLQRGGKMIFPLPNVEVYPA